MKISDVHSQLLKDIPLSIGGPEKSIPFKGTLVAREYVMFPLLPSLKKSQRLLACAIAVTVAKLQMRLAVEETQHGAPKILFQEWKLLRKIDQTTNLYTKPFAVVLGASMLIKRTK